MLKEYLNLLQKTINQGDAREESYYKHLDWLIRIFSTEQNIKNVEITILPKNTEAGNPDFRVWDGNNHITGYIEAKDPSVTNLDWIAESEQLKRYRNTFPNLLLTNFFEFRLYRDGEFLKKASVGRYSIAEKLKTNPPAEHEAEFFDLFNTFFSFSLPQVRSARDLAVELARRTRFLRDEVISIELAQEEQKGKKAILGFYEAFKKYLIGTLTPKTFADLYSQTITYGLFAARTRSNKEFNRKLAFSFIPNTIGILRDIFQFISLGDLPKPLEIIVDDISEILSVTDVNKILQDYYQEGKGHDPIIHFYETFLTAYDPAIRDKRGVYYTPEPVVKYIVQAVHQILKSHFNQADGLSSNEVTLLDPAGGTLTFPAEAIKTAVNEYTAKYGSGGKTKLIRNHILQNFYAFELMMAPYAIGHLKMSFLIEELGYSLKDDERFRLYLTNTLEMEDLEQISIPGLSSLSEESHLAGKVKKEQPILVIIGNPPYSGISSNINAWTEKLLKQNIDGATSYYEVDGKPLGEKKLWLQDDYVKFLRFAQWKIQKAGYGIVAMITNHSYLDNPTFRGMRQSLMNTYNEIYLLDLHGNSLKKETNPIGGKDENVFDIRQGTAIALFIKQRDKVGCMVYHADLFGLRNEKYSWLNTNDFKQEHYTSLKPESPWYFFIPRDTDKIRNYHGWKAINEIFPVNVTGIVTARDGLAIDFSENALRSKIMIFRNKNVDDHTIEQAYCVRDNYQWKLSEQRVIFMRDLNWEKSFKKILYRPFDVRYIFYHENIVFRTRKEVMHHMLEVNLSICFMRQFSASMSYTHFLVSDLMVDNRTFFSSKGIIQQAPLYLYREKKSKKSHFQPMMVFEPEVEYKTKVANIDSVVYERLNNTYKKRLTPEEILYYIYSVFYSNIYRQKYAELLSTDFPRVPFTSSYQTFKQMSVLGEQLVNLHLLKGSDFKSLVSKYQGEGTNNMVEKVNYIENEQRVYINHEKYFDNIEPEVWNYQIGGYQVLKKYLDERKKAGRDVGDEIHYSKIVTALSKTIQLQVMIDHVYPELEKQLLEL